MTKLAIRGGNVLFKKGIRSTWPIVDNKEPIAAARVAKSGAWWRYSGKETDNFEAAFSKFQGSKYSLLVNNGTVSIETSLTALGIQPGDEVIVPAITFIASASGVLMARGVPVFADILPDTFQIDPKSIEDKITSRTRGIIVVHYGGYPADMDAIKRIARRHGLFIFEDCAHAQGSQWKGKGVGAIGDMGSFSFQQSKAITCGEGGVITTNDKKLIDFAKVIRVIETNPI